MNYCPFDEIPSFTGDKCFKLFPENNCDQPNEPFQNNINENKFTKNSLKVGFGNVISMFNKLSLICQYLDLTSTDLLFLTETWLNSKVLDSMVCLKDYEIIRQDRHHSRGGGVALLYKKHLRVNQINTISPIAKSSSTKFEYVCVDLFDGKSIVRFCCVYIPPSSSHCSSTMSLICSTLLKLVSPTIPFFLFGDFNLPHINWKIPASLGNSSHDVFLAFSLSNCLTQQIMQPTHNKGNILDLLFCNMLATKYLLSHSVDSPLSSKCDHNMINFEIELQNSLPQISKKPYPNFANADYSQIKNQLNQIDWTNLYNSTLNLHSFYNSFIEILQDIIHRFVPTSKQKRFNKQHYPKFIKTLLKEKKSLYKKFKVDKSLKYDYKLKCKEYENAVKNWNNNIELKLCENPSPRKFYKFVNQKLKCRSSIPPLIDDANNVFISDKDKANLFNSQFQKFFVKDDNINPLLGQKQVPDMQNFLIMVV